MISLKFYFKETYFIYLESGSDFQSLSYKRFNLKLVRVGTSESVKLLQYLKGIQCWFVNTTNKTKQDTICI